MGSRGLLFAQWGGPFRELVNSTAPSTWRKTYTEEKFLFSKFKFEKWTVCLIRRIVFQQSTVFCILCYSIVVEYRVLFLSFGWCDDVRTSHTFGFSVQCQEFQGRDSFSYYFQFGDFFPINISIEYTLDYLITDRLGWLGITALNHANHYIIIKCFLINSNNDCVVPAPSSNQPEMVGKLGQSERCGCCGPLGNVLYLDDIQCNWNVF